MSSPQFQGQIHKYLMVGRGAYFDSENTEFFLTLQPKKAMKFFKISKSLNSPFPTLSFGLPLRFYSIKQLRDLRSTTAPGYYFITGQAPPPPSPPHFWKVSKGYIYASQYKVNLKNSSFCWNFLVTSFTSVISSVFSLP